ncbi:MAG: hypothetical protein ABI821_11500 [Pseudomonadota bacterium]
MPTIELTDSELASLALAARVAREQAFGDAAKQGQSSTRGIFEDAAERYNALSVKLEAIRKSAPSQQKADSRGR